SRATRWQSGRRSAGRRHAKGARVASQCARCSTNLCTLLSIGVDDMSLIVKLEKRGETANLRRGKTPKKAGRIAPGTRLAMQQPDDNGGRCGRLGLASGSRPEVVAPRGADRGETSMRTLVANAAIGAMVLGLSATFASAADAQKDLPGPIDS